MRTLSVIILAVILASGCKNLNKSQEEQEIDKLLARIDSLESVLNGIDEQKYKTADMKVYENTQRILKTNLKQGDPFFSTFIQYAGLRRPLNNISRDKESISTDLAAFKEKLTSLREEVRNKTATSDLYKLLTGEITSRVDQHRITLEKTLQKASEGMQKYDSLSPMISDYLNK
jgi:uncharacterized coiled-coil DUF342 family protein